MTSPADPAGAGQYIRLPYPADSDQRIRKVAELVAYEQAVQILDMIKNELCGNAERAETVADQWGQDTSMNVSKLELNSMRDSLSAYWKGPAFNAFNTYTITAVGTMDKDLGVMGTMATTLGNSVATVFSTYASAITLIGNCVANLGAAGAWLAIAFATAEIPGVDVLTSAVALNKLVDVLVAFVKDVTTLVANAVTQIGLYKAQAISFANQATQFQHPEPLPGATGHVGEWQVNPNR